MVVSASVAARDSTALCATAVSSPVAGSTRKSSSSMPMVRTTLLQGVRAGGSRVGRVAGAAAAGTLPTTAAATRLAGSGRE